MPIFEYLCKDCGSKFEKLVRRSGDSVECPSCGKSDLAPQLSTFAAHANGRQQSAPKGMCPSGGVCPTPGACGLN